MAAEQSETRVKSAQDPRVPRPTPAPAPVGSPANRKSKTLWRGLLAGFAVLVLVGGAAYFYYHQAHPTRAVADPDAKAAAAKKAMPLVEVVQPRPGGLTRVTYQPGTLHAFQAAKLYAKVSGYLMTLNVDIGDRVEKGDTLAEIDDPEAEKAVEQAAAALKQTEAAVAQARAKIDTTEADVLSARANLTKAQADVKEFTAQRVYRQSELARYQQLARDKSIEQKLVDEEQERYSAAVAGEAAAEASVEASRAMVVAAQARVESAKADLQEAHANVGVAQANLDRARVLAAYTTISAPFDGVITARNFFVGDFIQSAADGERMPLLALAKTDKLRVVVRVPDRDVPFVDTNDEAVITIDALPGQEFRGKVARFAESEDPADRTMRTEIDLPNDGGKLREGMYGNVRIVLEAAAEGALTIPSNALVEQDGAGQGAVYLVRDGKIDRQIVTVGKDNGKEVEITHGLSDQDEVVVRYSGTISEGLAVRTEEAKDAGSEADKG